MPHDGSLNRQGTYLGKDGEKHLLFAHALHSETNEQYLLLTTGSIPTPLAITVADFNDQATKPYTLQAPQHITNIQEFLGRDVEAGTYEHYKSKPEDRKLYNVLGTTQMPDGTKCVVYHPLYGQQVLMLRPLEAVNPDDYDEGAFTQYVEMPGYNYKGPRFFKTGDVTE